jgi:hypothetical protein
VAGIIRWTVSNRMQFGHLNMNVKDWWNSPHFEGPANMQEDPVRSNTQTPDKKSASTPYIQALHMLLTNLLRLMARILH